MEDERIAVVIPCFNEEERLDRHAVAALVHGGLDVILADDGSTDRTADLLVELAAGHPGRVSVVTLPVNQGKAEAVRQGLLTADTETYDVVGYLDADFATPVEEMLRLVEARRTHGVDVLLGSRVALAGRLIHRNAARHYLGRIFATVASSYVLRAPIYDTQCGAKVFVNNERFRLVIESPFHSPWAFDVELLGRLLHGMGDSEALPFSSFREEPLERWVDKPGSKISARAMVVSTLELLSIRRRLPADSIDVIDPGYESVG